MLTREQIIEALDFLEKAYEKYHSDRNGVTNLIRNYMIDHNELNDFLIMQDFAYSEFKRYGRIDTDFTSALRTLRNEKRKLELLK